MKNPLNVIASLTAIAMVLNILQIKVVMSGPQQEAAHGSQNQLRLKVFIAGWNKYMNFDW